MQVDEKVELKASAPSLAVIDSEDLELPDICEKLTPSELDEAKRIQAKYPKKSFEECCYEARGKRPRTAGRRKTRRTRKNKKRQQKKSRKNYK
jgi:hypothetical protein